MVEQRYRRPGSREPKGRHRTRGAGADDGYLHMAKFKGLSPAD
jgi:hypothetical protein